MSWPAASAVARAPRGDTAFQDDPAAARRGGRRRRWRWPSPCCSSTAAARLLMHAASSGTGPGAGGCAWGAPEASRTFWNPQPQLGFPPYLDEEGKRAASEWARAASSCQFGRGGGGGVVRKRWREEGGRRYEGASWPSDLWSDGGGFSGFSVMGFERCQIGSQEALFVSEMDIRRITCVLKNVKFWIDIFIVKCMFDKALSLLELELNQTVSDSPYRDVYYKRRMY